MVLVLMLARVATKSTRLKGKPVDVARKLAEKGRIDELLALFEKVVDRNTQLERVVASALGPKNPRDHVATEQLKLALGQIADLAKSGDLDAAVAKANEELARASEENGGRPEVPKPPKQPAVRKPAPEKLRRIANPIRVADDERACPQCGTPRKTVATETTEVIDFIPAEVIVRIDEREVCACPKCEGEMVRAPQGDKVVCGGAYGSRLVAELVVGKYADGLPLHRQREIFQRLGLDMPSSSMADQIMWATDLLAPIRRGLIAELLGSEIVHVDATSMPVRDKETKGAVHLGALWGYVGRGESGPTCAVYLFTSTGKKNGQLEGEIGPEDLLAKRTGYVVADAGSVFDASFEREDLTEIGCNMHARRYFVKAFDAGDKRAALPIDAYRALYDIEASVAGADADAVLAARRDRSAPVYEELLRWALLHKEREPPSSLLARAVTYLANNALALTRFLGDGRIPIDNGVVERLHRDVAILRKNCLFAGSYAGGERAAIALSVLASCDVLEINPTEYLASVLPTLARGSLKGSQLRALLPSQWKRTGRTAPAPVTSSTQPPQPVPDEADPGAENGAVAT